MTKTANFWDRNAESYARSKVGDEQAYETKLKITRDLFSPEAKVLEIACGTGTTALRHAPHVKHYLATDISAKMLEIARAKARDQGITNVTFEQQDIASASLPKAEFDAVLAMSILHLIQDRPAALAKICDSLKPGGVFVSSTICLGNMAFFFPVLIKAMKLVGKAPDIVESLNHEDIAAAISDAGLIIEDHQRMTKDKVAFIIARKPR
ncbi:MAG: class I SAM-dependent methyltransferase [Parvibaculaceae bacterium]